MLLPWLQAPLAVDMRAGLAAGEQVELPGQGEESVDAPFERQREQATSPIFYSHPDQVATPSFTPSPWWPPCRGARHHRRQVPGSFKQLLVKATTPILCSHQAASQVYVDLCSCPDCMCKVLGSTTCLQCQPLHELHVPCCPNPSGASFWSQERLPVRVASSVFSTHLTHILGNQVCCPLYAFEENLTCCISVGRLPLHLRANPGVDVRLIRTASPVA